MLLSTPSRLCKQRASNQRIHVLKPAALVLGDEEEREHFNYCYYYYHYHYHRFLPFPPSPPQLHPTLNPAAEHRGRDRRGHESKRHPRGQLPERGALAGQPHAGLHPIRDAGGAHRQHLPQRHLLLARRGCMHSMPCRDRVARRRGLQRHDLRRVQCGDLCGHRIVRVHQLPRQHLLCTVQGIHHRAVPCVPPRHHLHRGLGQCAVVRVQQRVLRVQQHHPGLRRGGQFARLRGRSVNQRAARGVLSVAFFIIKIINYKKLIQNGSLLLLVYTAPFWLTIPPLFKRTHEPQILQPLAAADQLCINLGHVLLHSS